MLTHRQLAYMKHFSEPLTALASSDSADIDLASESARPFVDALAARLRLPAGADMLGVVDTAREAFSQRARRLRMGISVAEVVRKVAGTKVDEGPLQFASAVMRGRAEKDVEHLGVVIKCVPGPRFKARLTSYCNQEVVDGTAPGACGGTIGSVIV